MRDEIPHGIAVVVERFKERPGTDLIDIDVNIYCERESHKGMVIGRGGAGIEDIKKALKAFTTKLSTLTSLKSNRLKWMQLSLLKTWPVSSNAASASAAL